MEVGTSHPSALADLVSGVKETPARFKRFSRDVTSHLDRGRRRSAAASARLPGGGSDGAPIPRRTCVIRCRRGRGIDLCRYCRCCQCCCTPRELGNACFARLCRRRARGLHGAALHEPGDDEDEAEDSSSDVRRSGSGARRLKAKIRARRVVTILQSDAYAGRATVTAGDIASLAGASLPDTLRFLRRFLPSAVPEGLDLVAEMNELTVRSAPSQRSVPAGVAGGTSVSSDVRALSNYSGLAGSRTGRDGARVGGARFNARMVLGDPIVRRAVGGTAAVPDAGGGDGDDGSGDDSSDAERTGHTRGPVPPSEDGSLHGIPQKAASLAPAAQIRPQSSVRKAPPPRQAVPSRVIRNPLAAAAAAAATSAVGGVDGRAPMEARGDSPRNNTFVRQLPPLAPAPDARPRPPPVVIAQPRRPDSARSTISAASSHARPLDSPRHHSGDTPRFDAPLRGASMSDATQPLLPTEIPLHSGDAAPSSSVQSVSSAIARSSAAHHALMHPHNLPAPLLPPDFPHGAVDIHASSADALLSRSLADTYRGAVAAAAGGEAVAVTGSRPPSTALPAPALEPPSPRHVGMPSEPAAAKPPATGTRPAPRAPVTAPPRDGASPMTARERLTQRRWGQLQQSGAPADDNATDSALAGAASRRPAATRAVGTLSLKALQNDVAADRHGTAALAIQRVARGFLLRRAVRGWQRIVDKGDGDVYWYHAGRGQSSWVPPGRTAPAES